MNFESILGIEGGGTRTTWVLLNGQGRVLRRGEAGPGNVLLLTDKALDQLTQAIRGAAGSKAGGVVAIGATFAGCHQPREQERVRRALAVHWPKAKIVVGGDVNSALVSAHGAEDGICVIAGTGSNVVAQIKGHVEKAGGWGHVFSDHGSAYDLVRHGLESVYTLYDEKQVVGPMGQIFLRVTAQNSLEDLVRWVIGRAGKTDVAALAPCVFEAARAGDKAAKKILHGGAEELARRVLFLARRLKWKQPRVGLCGGLFQKSPAYVALVRRAISRKLPGSTIFVVEASGAVAAAALTGFVGKKGAAFGSGKKGQGVASTAPTPESIARSSTEQRNPRSHRLEKRSVPNLVDLFITEEAYVQRALKAQRKEIAKAATLISKSLKKGGCLFYIGAGTSGRLGVVDASEMPPTFNAPPEQVQAIMAGGYAAVFKSQEGAEDDAAAGALAIIQRGVRRGDVVCGIAASGQTQFVHGALREARRKRIATVLLTCNPNRPHYDYIDVIIDLPTGPEIVTGSTRLKAGTATKVALNMLSTISMIQLGRVHDNLMIDVQATNAKLRLRAKRLVMTLLKCDEEQAEQLLKANKWSVRDVVNKKTKVEKGAQQEFKMQGKRLTLGIKR